MPATAAASLVRIGRVTCIAHAGQLAYPMWRKVKDQIKAVRAQLEDGAQVQPGLAALVCARARSASRHSAQAKPSQAGLRVGAPQQLSAAGFPVHPRGTPCVPKRRRGCRRWLMSSRRVSKRAMQALLRLAPYGHCRICRSWPPTRPAVPALGECGETFAALRRDQSTLCARAMGA